MRPRRAGGGASRPVRARHRRRRAVRTSRLTRLRGLAALLVIVAAFGCNGRVAAPTPSVETGVVIAVEGTGPASAERFTLRTAEGALFEFDVERLDVSGGGKPAPHLREHQLDGAPIVVEYREQDGRYVALRYRDAE